jgi:hypothetical protein
MRKDNKLVADYSDPIVLTNMIKNRGEFKDRPVFSQTNFEKSTDYFHIQPHEESHAVRRKAILAKYGPEIKKLMVKDYRSAIVCVIAVTIQMSLAYYLQDKSWPVWLGILWLVGGTVNHTC